MASLAGLPAELLLAIIESEGSPWGQRRMIITLRATCVEINTKIKHYFGLKCFSRIKVDLHEAGIARLQAISVSTYAIYVTHITINVPDLEEGGYYRQTTDASEESRSWFSITALRALGDDINDDDDNYEVRLDETVADFVLDGSCGHILNTALSGLSQLRSLCIQPPIIYGWTPTSVNAEIQRVWLVASKILLNAAFMRISTLEEFLVQHYEDDDYERSLPLHLSALEVAALQWPSWAESLQKLELSLTIDHPECVLDHCNQGIFTAEQCRTGTVAMNARLLTTFLRTFRSVTEFSLWLPQAELIYLDHLANALPHLVLRSLQLSGITTQFSQLATILVSSHETLQQFKLSYSTFSQYADFTQLLKLLLCLSKLESCTLESLNVSDEGLHLGKVNQMRPVVGTLPWPAPVEIGWEMVLTKEGRGASYEREITIRTSEGDDIGYWLHMVLQHAQLGQAWEFESSFEN